MERVGVRARVRKKKADWLGIFVKEKVRAPQCPSKRRVIQRGKKKKGSEEKKSRQAHRAALTDQHWLKDMWKDCSQNTALPSWTFHSAKNCSRSKRPSKRNMPVNNLSVFRQLRGLKHMAICVTASLNSQNLQVYIYNLVCTEIKICGWDRIPKIMKHLAKNWNWKHYCSHVKQIK